MRYTFGAGLAAVLIGGPAGNAQPAAQPDTAAFDRQVRDALGEVHNRGADLYNLAKDYPAAYRLYEGSLRTVRPLLAHRPAVQKRIDAGLAAAEKEADPARRAFLLHEAIEGVRADLKTPAAEAKPAEKKAEPKKEPPAPKPKDPPAKADGGDVTGTILYQGKPVAGGQVALVSLDLPAPKVVTVPTAADGTFAAKGLPPGKYVVTVTKVENGKSLLPAKYATTDTSGITAELKAGPNQFDLNLR